MGGQPERSGAPMPPESFEGGCPGSWYRCRFVMSLLPYQRPCANGVFSPNLRLDRCRDPLVIEAVRYWEQQQLRVSARAMELLEQ